jgi:hypothetical protein
VNAGTVAPTISNVETIQLTALGAATVDFVNTTGVTSIVNSASSAALIVDNVVAIAPVTIQNTAQDTTVTFKDAAVAGTTDAVTLNLSSVSGGIITLGGETTAGAGFETVNIVATGTNVTGNVAFGTTATTLNISGTGSLDINAAAEFAAVQTIDASGLSGSLAIALADRTATSDTLDLTITTGAGADDVDISAVVDADVDNITIDLGAGADRLTLVQAAHNADTGNSMSGGAGTDTLNLGIAMTSVVAAYVSNFEVLEFTMTADLAQDMDVADSMNIVSVFDTAATTDDLTLTNVADGFVLNLNGALLATTSAAGTADIGIVISTLKTDTASDDMTVNLSATAGGVTIGSFNPDILYETVTVTSSGTAGNEILTVGTAKNNIVLTGATALTLTSTGSLTGVVDAAAMTGVFTTTTSTTALSVTGGSGDDVITTGAATAAQTINAGAGDDTITAGAIVGTAAGSVAYTFNGDAGSDTITTAAAAGIAGGALGTDAIFSINGGAGVDFITLGADGDVSHDIVSTATTVADADRLSGFETGAAAQDDDYDYNGALLNDTATTVVSTSSTTLVLSLASDVDATNFIVSTALTSTADSTLTTLANTTASAAFTTAAAAFETALVASLGTVTGLDTIVGSGESVLLTFVNAADSVVVRFTNSDTTTANTITVAEIEVVAVFDGTVLVATDFI